MIVLSSLACSFFLVSRPADHHARAMRYHARPTPPRRAGDRGVLARARRPLASAVPTRRSDRRSTRLRIAADPLPRAGAPAGTRAQWRDSGETFHANPPFFGDA